MTRVVLDTNIVVSAMLHPGGLPYAVLSLGLAGKFQLCVSEPMLTEYAKVLGRPRFGFGAERVVEVMGHIRRAAVLVNPTLRVTAASDPDDNVFLECAEAGEAGYLVTGNTKHFPAEWKQARVVTVRQFFEVMADWRVPASAVVLG